MKIFGLELKFNGFDIWHKGNFNPSTVATSGKYSDLSGTPTSLPASGGTAASCSGNSATATKLQNIRTISITGDATGSTSFDGSASSSINIGLAATGIAAGTYKSVTVDTKGRVIAGTNPTTLSGYGITDALPVSSYTASDVLAKLKTVDGSGSGLDADAVDGLNATDFGRAYSSAYSFGGSQVAIATADFITLLSGLGAFNQPYWVSRGSWAYASNKYISDTGIGNIHLAGCTVEVIGNSSNYTIRIHTPTTSASGVINTEYIYVNNGSSYSPGWRKIWNDKNDGAGSGLDADKLDGQEGSYYAPVSSPTLTGTPKSTTPSTADNSTNIATTAFVKAQGYITAAGSGAKISVASVAPSSPQPGDFWYKTV